MTVLDSKEIEMASTLRQQLQCVSPVNFITIRKDISIEDENGVLNVASGNIKQEVSIIKSIIDAFVSLFK